MKRKDLEVGKLYVFKDGCGFSSVGKLLDLHGTPHTGHRPGFQAGPSSSEVRRADRAVTIQLMGWERKDGDGEFLVSSYTCGPVEEAEPVLGWGEKPITSQPRLADVRCEWDDDAWADHQSREQEHLEHAQAFQRDVAACQAIAPRLDVLLKRLGLPDASSTGGRLASDNSPVLHIDVKLTPEQAEALLAQYGES